MSEYPFGDFNVSLTVKALALLAATEAKIESEKFESFWKLYLGHLGREAFEQSLPDKQDEPNDDPGNDVVFHPVCKMLAFFLLGFSFAMVVFCCFVFVYSIQSLNV